jgi:hypothetical protein
MGRIMLAGTMMVLLACACESVETERDAVDGHVDDAGLDPDAGDLPTDGADKAPFPATTCAADPAAALVEVRLTDLEIVASVSTAPAADALPIDEMAAVMLAMLREQGYPVDNLAGASRSTSEYSGLDLVRLEGGDPFAKGIFHRMTARPVVIWAGDWTNYSKIYFPPDPLDPEAAVLYEPASDPAGLYREESSDTCDLAEMEMVMSPLNEWGSTWAGMSGASWTDRTFREIWDLVLGTGAFNGFAACGPYEVFAFGLGPVGGSYSGNVDMIKLGFILTGKVDQSQL